MNQEMESVVNQEYEEPDDIEVDSTIKPHTDYERYSPPKNYRESDLTPEVLKLTNLPRQNGSVQSFLLSLPILLQHGKIAVMKCNATRKEMLDLAKQLQQSENTI